MRTFEMLFVDGRMSRSTFFMFFVHCSQVEWPVSDPMTDAFGGFIEHLVSAHTIYLRPVCETLVKRFLPRMFSFSPFTSLLQDHIGIHNITCPWHCLLTFGQRMSRWRRRV